jgi:hypothetical protein
MERRILLYASFLSLGRRLASAALFLWGREALVEIVDGFRAGFFNNSTR